jgi:hypothetical protein
MIKEAVVFIPGMTRGLKLQILQSDVIDNLSRSWLSFNSWFPKNCCKSMDVQQS